VVIGTVKEEVVTANFGSVELVILAG